METILFGDDPQNYAINYTNMKYALNAQKIDQKVKLNRFKDIVQ